MASSKKKKKAKKKILSPEEKATRSLQRRHRNEIRATFVAAGFSRVDGAADKQFTFDGVTSDFDDAFIMENVIVFAEYTITKESEISAHIKPKYILYEKIAKGQASFVAFARGAPLNLEGSLDSKYKNEHFRVVILYCSLNTVKAELKEQIPYATFLDYSVVRYFKLLTRTVKLSARNEMLAFLGVGYSEFGDRAVMSNPPSREPFPGSVLPESHSNFPQGFKVVSFYIDPAALLSRSYVLRRDGWRERSGLYQRMIIRGKIESVRKYLVEHKRVFVNNIIVTLPDGTKVLDQNDDTIDPAKINKTQAGTISIPYDFNSIGLIDGQHRVFSYYEGGTNEKVIAPLRTQQNLLVTGIIYPSGVGPDEKTRFEAALFLEINSNQANAKSELKQAINQIIRPFTVDSIARDVLDKLNDGTGALADKFARHYFETQFIKTTSVVSYGLRPLVRPSLPGPIFSRWTDPDKDTFVATENDVARKRYIDHCATQIGVFIAAAKSQLPSSLWTTDRKVKDRLLTPTVINGLIGAMRQAVEAGVPMSFEALRIAFSGLGEFPFSTYTSSRYTVMSSDIYTQFLASLATASADSD
ncbi:DGQHR domain-containing protein [Aminobacter carboxidus]|uniref:DGQHR domain-containing protein n=1 Tax=Aminobacter carboxidus TaxID=376165 RepID=A0ABR9GXN8_9HYPH|nr:DGQHR domain-containing protein [Aminobacter carboxidus]MBE1208380.1 DGQHR domain-containing protein [Aminobacter carboxidus]